MTKYRRKQFKPWVADRTLGIKLLLLGSFSAILAVGFAVNEHYAAALVFGLLALVMANWSSKHFRKASARRFGKEFEGTFVEHAYYELVKSGLEPKANVMVRGIGDVDLVVYGEKCITVEIKSFRKWNQKFGFWGDREKRTLNQAEKQRRALKAKYGIVWLPQGEPTVLQRIFGVKMGDVRVVFGDQRALVGAVKGLLESI